MAGVFLRKPIAYLLQLTIPEFELVFGNDVHTKLTSEETVTNCKEKHLHGLVYTVGDIYNAQALDVRPTGDLQFATRLYLVMSTLEPRQLCSCLRLSLLFYLWS